MASIKVKFRPSSIAGHEGTIYYQIIHERRVRQIHSVYRVFPSEWDRTRSMVKVAATSERKTLILSVRERIYWDIERLNKICHKLDDTGLPYSADDILAEFKRYAEEYSLSAFMEGLISKLRLNGRFRTSETYRSALNSFNKFLQGRSLPEAEGGRDDDGGGLMLDSLTAEIMEAYGAWLRERGVVPNTISFYARILRAVYNRAVGEGVILNRHPFRNIYTGVDRTVKRALPIGMIKKIKALDLSTEPALDFARNMFLMSFYLRGMSFIDMAFLKKPDLRHGYVIYCRRKTGRRLTIEWTREMQSLLDKYPENESDYLLPIIRRPGANERCAYRNMSYNINRNLKAIAGMVGITTPLTLYVARHSWATAAKSKGIPLGVISEGLGHDSETTTRIYLAALDASVVDRANSVILQSL